MARRSGPSGPPPQLPIGFPRDQAEPESPAVRRSPVPPLLRSAADVSWRLLVVAVVALGVAYFLVRIWVVPLALFLALLLATVLAPPVRFLERHRWPSLLATALVFVALLGAVSALGLLVIPSLAGEFERLGPILAQGIDNLERWLAEGPLDLGRERAEGYRRIAFEQGGDLLRSSSGGLLAGALVLFETLAGLLLAFVVCFFLVKDGPGLQRGALSLVGPERRERVAVACAAAWRALGGYLRAVVVIGLVEAVVIGLTLLLVGARLVVPVAVLTFLGAFLPIVGAALAGVVAVLVALVSGGTGDALIVGVVALVVQQLDNDFLAPLVYGRAVDLHAVVILLVLAAGGSLAGVAGAFLAVPLTAMTVAAWGALDRRRGETANASSAFGSVAG